MFGSPVNTPSGIFPEDSPVLMNSVIQCFVLRNTNTPNLVADIEGGKEVEGV